ncbi:hypothetical protein [Bacterioplanoides sp. SCSIO 12839]|uniref:hypothetical protein n=1 Tax=Bacterioplanoides sp. SCSIO 12839 TaxID=2829569 RepID=UPI0021051F69|nr:hypothetical protein [Bacterioplanoides sp. SCSIO 12839]UTW47128.1 hypothetical protein KFF03_11060 [Bacterioplanoides sp. SCSIO 12839]
MTNGSNDWGTPYCDITFLGRLLRTHKNVSSVSRSNDILFTVEREQQGDTLKILCLREYTMGRTMVDRAIDEFGDLDIIYIGGDWNGYQPEAKELCLDSKIGLYVTSEMSGALWRNQYWNYEKKDKDGDPVTFTK